MKFVYKIMIFIILIAIYFSLNQVRESIFGSDIYTSISEFSSIEMSEYNLREPIYWFTGKFLYMINQNGWETILIIDAFAFFCLYNYDREILAKPISIALLLSPIFLLGVTNIHRQMVAFCLWILIVSRQKDTVITPLLALHIIPFMIHNSLIILSIIFIISRYLNKNNIRYIALFLFSILTVSIVFRNEIFGFFREGTEISTGFLPYFAWAAAVGVLCYLYGDQSKESIIFFILGVAIASLLYFLSGGSSGSRFFMLVVTAQVMLAIKKVDSEGSTRWRTFVHVSLAAVLVMPTWFNSFSRDIVVAAYYGIPYGVAT